MNSLRNLDAAATKWAFEQFCHTKCPQDLYGLGETSAQEAEERGYLKLARPRTLEERIEVLRTPSGAIAYIGAILRMGADIARNGGWAINDDPAQLAQFYRGYTARTWENTLKAKPRNQPIIMDDKMGKWIENKLSYIEDGVGAPAVKKDVLHKGND